MGGKGRRRKKRRTFRRLIELVARLTRDESFESVCTSGGTSRREGRRRGERKKCQYRASKGERQKKEKERRTGDQHLVRNDQQERKLAQRRQLRNPGEVYDLLHRFWPPPPADKDPLCASRNDEPQSVGRPKWNGTRRFPKLIRCSTASTAAGDVRSDQTPDRQTRRPKRLIRQRIQPHNPPRLRPLGAHRNRLLERLFPV